MIRGSIEVAQSTRVAGWIYSSADTVRDKLILAFVGQRCVGAGKVDRFRKDLLEAKLGDGYCGYDFPIKLNDDENLGAVVVKLQNADAALIQSTSRMIGPDDAGGSAPDLGAIAPASVSWMQDRGWLDQPEYDFLKAIQNIGAYERGLRPPRRNGGEAPPALKPESVVSDLLSLYMLCDVDVARFTVKSVSELGTDASPLRKPGVSLAAIWSADRGRVSVDERSHAGQPASQGIILTEPPSGGIEYSFGPDRLLFLHKHISLAPQGPAPASGITVFIATVRAGLSAKAAVRAKSVQAA